MWIRGFTSLDVRLDSARHSIDGECYDLLREGSNHTGQTFTVENGTKSECDTARSCPRKPLELDCCMKLMNEQDRWLSL